MQKEREEQPYLVQNKRGYTTFILLKDSRVPLKIMTPQSGTFLK